ncbi:unnamed protein product [Chilo suppressalis]|uniref:Tetraspanin n=1 Tax=Chilo suppressalis TaxID=168631 RepID=A0ABN8BBJ2_CHISP|nr:hypothetical protein evm_000538 [Chilo suppressalis]CAH0406652.1 unnamed protein product [Chilo suppressalis]
MTGENADAAAAATTTAKPKPNIKLINKTETEYNMKSIRFLLLTITTMFMVIGGLMIVLGISVYSHYHSFSFLYETARSGRFLTPSVMCVFIGLALFVISFFGFFGSLKKSTCLVNMYALILLKIMIVNLVVVILVFTKNYETINKMIYIPIDQYVHDAEVQAEIDTMQVSLNCCGKTSYLDYAHMEFSSNQSTVLVSEEMNGELLTFRVPESCCASQSETSCLRLRPNSCARVLTVIVIQNANVLGVLGVSVMFILLLGIIFALLLARCIRKMKSERALMAWKIREQLILARKDEENRLNNSLYITPPESSLA